MRKLFLPLEYFWFNTCGREFFESVDVFTRPMSIRLRVVDIFKPLIDFPVKMIPKHFLPITTQFSFMENLILCLYTPPN
jgi:hypothetical protein